MDEYLFIANSYVLKESLIEKPIYAVPTVYEYVFNFVSWFMEEKCWIPFRSIDLILSDFHSDFLVMLMGSFCLVVAILSAVLVVLCCENRKDTTIGNIRVTVRRLFVWYLSNQILQLPILLYYVNDTYSWTGKSQTSFYVVSGIYLVILIFIESHFAAKKKKKDINYRESIMKVLDIEYIQTERETISHANMMPAGNNIYVPIQNHSEEVYPAHFKLILKDSNGCLYHVICFKHNMDLDEGEYIRILEAKKTASFRCEEEYDFVLNEYQKVE